MPELNPDDMSRFANFSIFTTTYKTVSDHPITTDVLIPKHLLSTARDAQAKPCPILLRFHGGGFIAGSSLFPDFFSRWLLELAERHSAVIVTPNYRLLPEATMDDVLADIEDHWTWLHAALPAFIATATPGAAIAPDTTRILATGDSAGGYLALAHALTHPTRIRAVAAEYPLVDPADPWFQTPNRAAMFGLPPFPATVIAAHRDKVARGEAPAVVSQDARGARVGLMFAGVQNGLKREFFPVGVAGMEHLFLVERLRRGERFPRGGVFVCHGKGDSVVPVEASVRFGELVRRLDPELPFHLALEEGDHGFAGSARLDDAWLAEGLKGVVEAWLA